MISIKSLCAIAERESAVCERKRERWKVGRDETFFAPSRSFTSRSISPQLFSLFLSFFPFFYSTVLLFYVYSMCVRCWGACCSVAARQLGWGRGTCRIDTEGSFKQWYITPEKVLFTQVYLVNVFKMVTVCALFRLILSLSLSLTHFHSVCVFPQL